MKRPEVCGSWRFAFLLGPYCDGCERLPSRRPFQTIRIMARTNAACPSAGSNRLVGGYPFEVAKTGADFDFYRKRGFILTRLLTSAGTPGCNEFVLRDQPRALLMLRWHRDSKTSKELLIRVFLVAARLSPRCLALAG